MTNTASVDLGKDRLQQAKLNYLKLSKQSYELPLNKEKASVPKWLKEKLKNEGKTL